MNKQHSILARTLARLYVNLVCLVCLSAILLGSPIAHSQVIGIPDPEELEIAAEVVGNAQEVVGEVPPDAMDTIQDAKVRISARRTFSVIERLAESDPENFFRVRSLYRRFDRDFLALEAASDGDLGAQTCTFQCREDRNDCQKDCKKKYCGCRFLAAVCIVLECPTRGRRR